MNGELNKLVDFCGQSSDRPTTTDQIVKALQEIVKAKNALALRIKVCDFAQTSSEVARNQVDLQVQVEALGTTWSSYWTNMRI